MKYMPCNILKYIYILLINRILKKYIGILKNISYIRGLLLKN
jgi:hypothetical protein